MIVEKPVCTHCNRNTNDSDIIYLKKIDDGWKCPNCGCEFYEKTKTDCIPYPIYPYCPDSASTYNAHPYYPWLTEDTKTRNKEITGTGG